MPIISASLMTGDPIDVEVRVRLRDGSWVWMRTRGKARRGLDGEIVRWYGIMEDIDECKRLKQALRELEAKYAALQKDRSSDS